MQGQYSGPYFERVVLLVIDGRPDSNLGRSFTDRQSENLGGLEFLVCRPADVVPTTRYDLFGYGAERGGLLFWRLYEGRRSEQDDRPIVHRMVECGAGKHKAVEQSDRDTDFDARGQCAKHTAGRRTMNEKGAPNTSVASRDDEGLALDHEAHMAQEAGIENAMDRRLRVVAPLGQPRHLRTFGRCVLIHPVFSFLIVLVPTTV